MSDNLLVAVLSEAIDNFRSRLDDAKKRKSGQEMYAYEEMLETLLSTRRKLKQVTNL